MSLTWSRVLAWRLGRQLLDPVGRGEVVDVVERLGAVPAWPDLTVELGIGARRTGGRWGDAAQALADRAVVKVFAFRGALHLMTPQDAGAYLAVRASSRMWELSSWVSHYDLAPEDWPRFRDYVRSALADGPLTRTELLAAFGRSKRYRHLKTLLADNDTLLKPLTWQGVMGLGPPRDGELTLLALDDVPGWAGVPDLDEAGPAVIRSYLRTYGPATAERIQDWFGKGLGARGRAVAGWLGRLDDELESVAVEGESALVLGEDADDLRSATASAAVRLLPGRDVWVMAPGTTHAHVVPPARRALVSGSANLVLARGAVAGTWAVRDERLAVTWFGESGRVPRTALEAEASRLGDFLDRELALEVTAD